MQRQLILVALALFLNFASLAQTPTSPAWKRAQHLRHGINASEWFAQSRDYSPQRLRTYTTLDDIVRMKQMRFDHVRLSIDPAIFECPPDPQTPAKGMPELWQQCPTVQV